MTAVIEASSAGVKDMADGSLRITFEFEPRHAAEAFALFGPRGRAVAIAALKDGAAKVAEPEKPKERERMGDLCYRAVMWCNDAEFQKWLGFEHGKNVRTSDQAAQFIREFCGVTSRKELDTNPAAQNLFQAFFVGPWKKYQMAGISI